MFNKFEIQDFYNKLFNFVVFTCLCQKFNTCGYNLSSFQRPLSRVIGYKPIPCDLDHSSSGNQPN